MLSDDAILCDVNKTTGKVTRVRRFQCGISQTLTGTVSGVEVLLHGQAFFKVRNNRRFNDRAIRLCHQAAHSSQLTHLGGRTTGTGVGHHVNRVYIIAFGRCRDDFHHLFGNVIGTLRPGINNFVVFLTTGDETILVLLFVFFDLVVGCAHQNFLGFRNDHVILTKRNTGFTCPVETKAHHAVSKDNSLFLATVTVNDIDNVRDVFFGQQLVDGRERNARMTRQQFGQQHTTGGRCNTNRDRLIVFINRFVTCIDFRMQVYETGIKGLFDFSDIDKGHALARLTVAFHRDVIKTKDNILGRHDNRFTRCR